MSHTIWVVISFTKLHNQCCSHSRNRLNRQENRRLTEMYATLRSELRAPSLASGQPCSPLFTEERAHAEIPDVNTADSATALHRNTDGRERIAAGGIRHRALRTPGITD